MRITFNLTFFIIQRVVSCDSEVRIRNSRQIAIFHDVLCEVVVVIFRVQLCTAETNEIIAQIY